jgi:hypothetical protein
MAARARAPAIWPIRVQMLAAAIASLVDSNVWVGRRSALPLVILQHTLGMGLRASHRAHRCLGIIVRCLQCGSRSSVAPRRGNNLLLRRPGISSTSTAVVEKILLY